MSDIASKKVDKEIAKLQKRIEEVYAEAERDMHDKLVSFANRFNVKNKKYLKQLADGKITQDDYNNWLNGQVFQGKQWADKRDQILGVLSNSNRISTNIINGRMSNVFALNGNYMAYTIERGFGVNFGFMLYDQFTIVNLIANDPQILPKWKIDEPKTYVWNAKKLNNAITQGIIQGERLDQITKRISTGLSTQNSNLMKTFARTGMTEAQNAGRYYRQMEAKSKGINLVKEWMSTLDGRTRDSHRDMDGEKIKVGDKWHPQKFSNGLRYPGDPEGPAREVYNCRCTLVADLIDYPSEYERYDNIDGRPIKNMTYREWEDAKKRGETLIRPVAQKPKFTQIGIGSCKSVEEINELLNSNGLFIGSSQADLSGCDLESAKSIAAAYEQVFSRFPQLKGKIDAPDAHPRNMKDNTYAWCYMRINGKVQVNPTKYSQWSSLVRQYEHDVSTRWHPYGTTAESIVTHEIGHAIDGLLAREGISGGVTASGQYRFASSNLRKVIMDRAASKDETIAKYWNAKDWTGKADKFWQEHAIERNVSRYAAKNPQEWFAECFAEYITSANPRLVASEFGKELEKLVSKIR